MHQCHVHQRLHQGRMLCARLAGWQAEGQSACMQPAPCPHAPPYEYSMPCTSTPVWKMPTPHLQVHIGCKGCKPSGGVCVGAGGTEICMAQAARAVPGACALLPSALQHATRSNESLPVHIIILWGEVVHILRGKQLHAWCA